MNWLQNLFRTSTLPARLLMSSAVWHGRVASEKGFLDADGTRIYYAVRGAGEPVVLIHGYSVSATINWKLPGILAELARSYQVVALDVRGHGRSDKPHDPAFAARELVFSQPFSQNGDWRCLLKSVTNRGPKKRIENTEQGMMNIEPKELLY